MEAFPEAPSYFTTSVSEGSVFGSGGRMSFLGVSHDYSGNGVGFYKTAS